MMKNKNTRMMISLVLNLLIIIIGVYIVFTVGTKAYSFGNKIFNEQSMDTVTDAREVEVTITDGMSPRRIAALLYDKGLVEDETIAYFQIQLSDYKDYITAGTYTLSTAMKPTDILEAISITDEDIEE